MIPDEDYIDFKYRKWLFDCQFSPPEIVGGSGGLCYQLECPLCGSPRSHLKWLPHKRTWKFLCSTKSKRNCQSQLEFPVLLKVWNPGLFLMYQQERAAAGTTGAGFNCPRPSPHHRKRKQLDLPKRPKCHDQNQPTGIGTSP